MGCWKEEGVLGKMCEWGNGTGLQKPSKHNQVKSMNEIFDFVVVTMRINKTVKPHNF